VSDLAIRDVMVVDVAKGETYGPRHVLIREGIIEAITPQRVDNDLPSIDGAGLFVIPGLIDAHVHFFFDAGSSPLPAYQQSDDESKLATAFRNAGTALAAGITTMRDLGAPPDLMETFLAAMRVRGAFGPHVVSSGAPLTRPGGHCYFFGGEVENATQVRKLIERQANQGARNVKVMASGGGMTPGTRPTQADFPIDLMVVACETAEANGMTITAHCHATEAIRRAVSGGIGCLEHVSFMEPSGHPRFDEEIAGQIKERGIAACPTVASGQRAALLFRKQGHGYHADDIGALERLEARAGIAARLHQLGVELIAGSDAGSDDTPFDVVLDEIEALHEAGLANADALGAATWQSAERLGLHRTGKLETGFVADLVLLSANPLVDLRALRMPELVIRDGMVAVDARVQRPTGSA
jgi:imidazolonepropionase-like amidohydrolase